MAMLRVSSYRKLFEEVAWSRNGGLSTQCAGQYRASIRSVWLVTHTSSKSKGLGFSLCVVIVLHTLKAVCYLKGNNLL